MGELDIVHCLSLQGKSDTRSRYKGRYASYRQIWGRQEITISPAEYRNMQVVGGLVTYIGPGQRGKVKRCWWYDRKGRKQHFGLIKVSGYIYEGYHAIDKQTALRRGTDLAKCKREQSAYALRQAKLADKQEKAQEKKYAEALRKQLS